MPGRAKAIHKVGPPSLLTREDLGHLFEPAFSRGRLKIEALRTQHHRIARLSAAGLRQGEIADRTDYSAGRISQLLASPAMKELVSHYLTVVDAAFERSQDEYMRVATCNMRRAENLIEARLDDAELEDAKPIPIRDLLAISRDAADRFGYGKKSAVVSLGSDFASQIEAAVRRGNAAPSQPTLEAPADV